MVSPRSSGVVLQASAQRAKSAPLALVIEPSKELAEQTYRQLQLFTKYLEAPRVRVVCIVGGLALKDQLAEVEQGADIVVATPGRLDDLVSTGRLSLEQVRFYVLDEVDGLLQQGQR